MLDTKTSTVVMIERVLNSELAGRFNLGEAVGRLTTFIDMARGLSGGEYVYQRERGKPHGSIYQSDRSEHVQSDLQLHTGVKLQLSPYTAQITLSATQLSPWQRHNKRLPLCFSPRRGGTNICHSYLSKNTCANKQGSCIYMHLTKEQLEAEIGKEKFEKFVLHFDKSKEDKVKESASTATPGGATGKKKGKGGKKGGRKRKLNPSGGNSGNHGNNGNGGGAGRGKKPKS